MGRAFEFRKARKMKRWSAMSKAFTRIGKDIVIAVKDGGPDPESNSRLRAVIQNAKSVNMPKENIERAVKRATEKGLGDYRILFEGYGPSGVAILVETASDNNTEQLQTLEVTLTNTMEIWELQDLLFLFDHICNFKIKKEILILKF